MSTQWAPSWTPANTSRTDQTNAPSVEYTTNGTSGHPRDAGWEFDECPDDRQQRADEHGGRSVLREEPVGRLDLVGPDQQVPTVSLEEGSATVRTDRIRDQRPEGVPDGGHDRHDPERPGVAGQWLDLARIGHQEPSVRKDQSDGSGTIADSIAMASITPTYPTAPYRLFRNGITISSMKASTHTSG